MVPMMMIDLSSCACTFIAWMEWLG
jgi:hypothetical protein